LLNTRGLFALWFVVLSLGQALFNRRLGRGWRLLLLAGALGWLGKVIGVSTDWLSGWVPTLLGVTVLAARRNLRFLLVVVLILAVIFAANWSYFAKVLENNRHESGDTRLDAAIRNWRITRTHLLFGLGPAGYEAYYRTYIPETPMATHNNYLDILSETGLVGLGFFLWFMLALGLAAYRLSVRLRGEGGFREGYAAAALAGWAGVVLAMFLGDWVIPYAYTQGIIGYDYALYNWIFLAGILSLEAMVAGQPGSLARGKGDCDEAGSVDLCGEL